MIFFIMYNYKMSEPELDEYEEVLPRGHLFTSDRPLTVDEQFRMRELQRSLRDQHTLEQMSEDPWHIKQRKDPKVIKETEEELTKLKRRAKIVVSKYKREKDKREKEGNLDIDDLKDNIKIMKKLLDDIIKLTQGWGYFYLHNPKFKSDINDIIKKLENEIENSEFEVQLDMAGSGKKKKSKKKTKKKYGGKTKKKSRGKTKKKSRGKTKKKRSKK